MSEKGLAVGKALEDYRGVLSGIPTFERARGRNE
jgi:hypothetical protein